MWTYKLSAGQTLMTRLDVTNRSHDMGDRHGIGGGRGHAKESSRVRGYSLRGAFGGAGNV